MIDMNKDCGRFAYHLYDDVWIMQDDFGVLHRVQLVLPMEEAKLDDS